MNIEQENEKSPEKIPSDKKNIGYSIEKVIYGCKILRSLVDKISKGHCPSHDEKQALLSFSQNTSDGIEWYCNNITASDDSLNTLDGLPHLDPFNCKKIQSLGLCPSTTKCFDICPITVENSTASLFYEPSPIRFGIGSGEDCLKVLLEEVETISQLNDRESKMRELKSIAIRAAKFDSSQQAILKSYVEKLGISKSSTITKLFKEANSIHSEKLKAALLQGSEFFEFNGRYYKFLNPGYALVKFEEEGGYSIIRQISDCYIDIREDRAILEESRIKKRILNVQFTNKRLTSDFEIDSADWADNNALHKKFMNNIGIAFNVKKSHLDELKQISQHTSDFGRQGMLPCKRTNYLSSPGWYDGTYITQSVIVDKNGARPNTEKPVYIQEEGQHASNIDFKLLSEPELLSTVFHIKSDFLKAFQRDHVMLGLGFTMLAGAHSYLDLPYKPVFWVEGTTGNGKTAYLTALQSFYGNFKGGVVWTATAKSILDYAFQFKDSLMLMDDFKAKDKYELKACSDIIQHSYEHTVRSALTKEGNQRGDKYARCLFLMTGEEAPTGASGIARMVILNAPQTDKTLTKEAYERVIEHKENYQGVTPKFIQWVLNRDKKEIQKLLLDYQEELQKPIRNVQNASRVAYNTAMCFVGWSLFCDFMVDVGAATDAEAEMFKAECKGYCETIRNISAERCTDEQSAIILINRLTEMLSAGEVGIKNLEGYDREGVRMIGFVDTKDNCPEVCYLYPSTTIEIVKQSMSNPVIISAVSAGAQLREMGALAREDKKGGPQIVKRIGKQTARVWCIYLKNLGIGKSIDEKSNSLELCN